MRDTGQNRLLHSAGDMADSVTPTIESFVDSLRKTSRPILKQGKKIAKQKAKQVRKVTREETKRAAGEKITAFGQTEAKRKGSPVKKLLLLGGLIAIGSIIVKRLVGAPSRSNWQTAYTPTPAPAPRPAAPDSAAAAAEDMPDDSGGASPDEALADNAAEPHPDTTPDEPAELVELEPEAAADDDADDDEPVALKKFETKKSAKAPKEAKPDPLTDPLPEDELAEPTPLEAEAKAKPRKKS